VYSGALDQALEVGSRIEVNALILSEFVNLVLRVEFRQHTQGQSQYKDFRKSEEYGAAARFCTSAISSILQQSTYVDFECPVSEMQTLIEQFGEDQTDFNDALIVHQCRQNNLILVTDDGDFQDAEINILTHNRKYF
jgi:predicted nucleic acid-binding protein